MKKIKKTYQGVVPNGKVLNTKSASQIDTYSCDYLNENLDIEDITDKLIFNSGFSRSTGRLYKQGKHIWGDLQIAGTFTANQNKKIAPMIEGVTTSGKICMAMTSNEEWGLPNGLAYFYIGNNGFDITSVVTSNYARVHIDFVIN